MEKARHGSERSNWFNSKGDEEHSSVQEVLEEGWGWLGQSNSIRRIPPKGRLKVGGAGAGM